MALLPKLEQEMFESTAGRQRFCLWTESWKQALKTLGDIMTKVQRTRNKNDTLWTTLRNWSNSM